MKTMEMKRTYDILVIGDIMLDTYYHGDVNRISPEAPVPVFNKKNERNTLGGAANVAANLVAAGQHAALMSVIGCDAEGQKLMQLMGQKGIDGNYVLTCQRMTTQKIRLLAGNNQQVLRLDVEENEPIDTKTCQKLIDLLETICSNYKLIILSDYMKGVLTKTLMQQIFRIAGKQGIPTLVDVKDSDYQKYCGAYLIKPNQRELSRLTGLSVNTDDEIITASETLRKLTASKYVLTTCGMRGMLLVGDGEPYFIDAVGKEVFDVTGAGDTALAYLSAGIADELPIREAVNIANLAAGIQVSKVGTSLVYPDELSQKKKSPAHDKYIPLECISEFREKFKEKTIVFTNGCFDILHIGHLRYLKEAAKLGDILIVAVNSDESVKRLKGNTRPINPIDDRLEMLENLEYVDYLTTFDEDTPLEVIKRIHPDVLVKGKDYEGKHVVGSEEVLSYGGKVILIDYTEGKSTSNVISKIQMSDKENSTNQYKV